MELFQWSFSSGAFPVAHFSVTLSVTMSKRFPLLEHLCLLWSFSYHLGLSPSDLSDGMMEWCFTSQGWGAASQDPGGRCPRLAVWSIPTGSSFCSTFMVKDNHRFLAQQCRETPGKPGQTCPKPLLQQCLDFLKSWKSSEGWKHNQHHTARCTSYFWCIHPHCSQENNISASELWSGASMWC